jgi:conjugal transfer mating pair stabilization protein TraG
VFQDPNFRTVLINYIHNCTMYDLVDRTVAPGTFASSDDVWALMGTPNPARFTTLAGGGGAITVDTCPNAYTNLNGRLPAQITRIEDKLAFRLNPTCPARPRPQPLPADPAGLREEQHRDRCGNGSGSPCASCPC